MKRIVFLTDIDGTLLNRDMAIPDHVISAASAFMEVGGQLGICTGRSYIGSIDVANTLQVNFPGILFGGAAIYDFEERKYIWQKPFDSDLILQAIRDIYAQFPSISIQVFSEDQVFRVRVNDRLRRRGIPVEVEGAISPIEAITGNILKVGLCSDSVSDLESCRELFTETQVNFANSSRHFVDIVDPGAGKAEAMKKLSTFYHLLKNEFHAAGDAYTDLPLLKVAGYAYAPENAIDEVKKEVNQIVPPIKDGGMAIAFENSKNMLLQGEI